MTSIPPETLARAPEEGARIVALRLLEDARSALERTADPSDREALHDLRVNLRRLRSTLRAYQRFLERQSTRSGLRQIRELGSTTNRARDLQVQIEWLEAHRGGLSSGQRRSINRLIAELGERRDWAQRNVLEGVPQSFKRLYDRLRSSLEAYAAVVHIDGSLAGPSFAAASAQLLRAQGARLQAALGRVHTRWDEQPAHAARIEAKRLRYLLEPLVAHVSGGRPLLRQLRSLQELLGELNDLRVLLHTLTAEIEHTALIHVRAQLDAALADDSESSRRLRRHTLENGLLAIVRLVGERRLERFERLEAEWLRDASAGFLADLERFATALARHGRAKVEIERKYLLSRLPECCASAASVLIEQGYLAGDQLRDRLRRVSSDAGERYLRTLKLGRGLARVELEEEIARETFERLWPLTEGSRVRKRRYRIDAGALCWEIDEFLDRPLVLAEVELPDLNTEVTLPDWLLPVLEREVTDEPGYTNLELSQS